MKTIPMLCFSKKILSREGSLLIIIPVYMKLSTKDKGIILLSL